MSQIKGTPVLQGREDVISHSFRRWGGGLLNNRANQPGRKMKQYA